LGSVGARAGPGTLVGVTALRMTSDAASAASNYDVVALVGSRVPRELCYPQLFGAVSGTACLLWADDGRGPDGAAAIRHALIRRAAALAEDTSAVLTFANLPDRRAAVDVARALGSADHGLIGADSVLDVTWVDFAGYLTGTVRPTRRRLERERYLASGLRTMIRSGGAALDARIAWLQAQNEAKYGAARPVAAVLADYDDLARTVGDRVLVFVAERAGLPVSASVCLRDGETLHIRSGGSDYAKLGNDYAYFNLTFYEPVLWGLEHGIRRFRIGGGAYRSKSARGCRVEPRYGAIRWPAHLAPVAGGALADREAATRRELEAIRVAV
jgi:predicted N-acyltransferase